MSVQHRLPSFETVFGFHISLTGKTEVLVEVPTHSHEDSEEYCQNRSSYGRWSEDEHDLFLKGLGKYGPDWERIAADIPTRTKLQVRTHASKCFHLTEIREKKRKKSDNEER